MRGVIRGIRLMPIYFLSLSALYSGESDKIVAHLILLSNSPFLPLTNSTKNLNFSVPSLTLSKVANVDFSSGGGFNAKVKFVDCLERMERIDKKSERIDRVEGASSV